MTTDTYSRGSNNSTRIINGRLEVAEEGQSSKLNVYGNGIWSSGSSMFYIPSQQHHSVHGLVETQEAADLENFTPNIINEKHLWSQRPTIGPKKTGLGLSSSSVLKHHAGYMESYGHGLILENNLNDISLGAAHRGITVGNNSSNSIRHFLGDDGNDNNRQPITSPNQLHPQNNNNRVDGLLSKEPSLTKLSTNSADYSPPSPVVRGTLSLSSRSMSSAQLAPSQPIPSSNAYRGGGSSRIEGPTGNVLATQTIDPNCKSELVGLDMSGFRIRNLSPGLFNYSFISELRLSNNFLMHLPAEIGRLRGLKHLDLSNNQLVELPRQIGWLTSLRELLVFNNQLQDLPAELGYLFQLETLGLDGNPISNEAILTVLHNQGPIAVVPFLRDHMTSMS